MLYSTLCTAIYERLFVGLSFAASLSSLMGGLAGRSRSRCRCSSGSGSGGVGDSVRGGVSGVGSDGGGVQQAAPGSCRTIRMHVTTCVVGSGASCACIGGHGMAWHGSV